MGQELFDGNLSFRGGQNSGVLPDRIGEDQYEKGVNITTKDGGIGPRPGFHQREITVVTEGGVTNSDGSVTSYQKILDKGKFQMIAPYVSDAGKHAIAVFSGVIFQINMKTRCASVLEIEAQTTTSTNISEKIEPATQRLNQYCRRLNWSEAGRYLVIYDYPDNPVLIEGTTARRSNPDATDAQGNACPEVFNAAIGTYNNNRLFVGSAVHEFTAGDPVGNAAAPDAPITFKEIFIEAAEFVGQSFSLGTTNQNNPITAMGFLQIPDTSTGIGPLFVATKDSVYTFRTDVPRAQWETISFGSLLLFNAGMAGSRSFVNVNSDLFFMSGDGQIRSLNVSRNSQGKWTNAPLDRGVRNWVKFNNDDLIPLSVASYFRNRVFFTVNPFQTKSLTLDGAVGRDFASEGLVVLELDNISGLLQDAQPVWSGIWTGVFPMDMFELDNEFFIVSKDPNFVNHFYSVEEDKTYDIFEDKVKQISSRVYTRQFAFQNKFILKEEKSVEPTLSNLEGDVAVRIDRKTESAGNFVKWRTWQHDAKSEECNSPCGCDTMPVLLPHAFRELQFGDPEETECNDVTNDDLSFFRKSQYRFTINAKNWKLEDFRASAETQEDDGKMTIDCEKVMGKTVEKDCDDVHDLCLHRTPFDSEKGDVCLWL